MKYTRATNYALHIMAYMISQDTTKNISLKPLADHFDLSANYLSKILTQLVKADLIQSVSGVNGGYRLRKDRATITFFDVIQAIEGNGALFTCDVNEPNCALQNVMRNAESAMDQYLQQQTLLEAISAYH